MVFSVWSLGEAHEELLGSPLGPLIHELSAMRELPPPFSDIRLQQPAEVSFQNFS